MLKNLLTIIFFACVAVHAQNCTSQPSMNIQNIASGNSVVGSSATNTLTVTLTGPFTSGTGWATIYNGAASSASFVGSYKIISYDPVAYKLVLDQTTRVNNGAVANGSTIGTYVSDLGVIKNSARKYTVIWTTPGFNSTSNLSYGDDIDSSGGYTGYNWIHQDTATGVQSHSVTIDNLDLVVGDNVGKYAFTVWSECFTGGAPDRVIGAALPRDPTLNPNTGRIAFFDQQIYVLGTASSAPGVADYTPGLNTFTLQSYDGKSSAYVVIPQQDGIHPGFRMNPGGTAPLNFYAFDTTIPASTLTPTGNSLVGLRVEDWNGLGTGLLALGKNGTVSGGGTLNGAWSGGQFNIGMGSGGGALSLVVPANAPTSGTACTSQGGDAITLDDGTPACSYPLRITANRSFTNSNYICGTAITCGPPGTVAQTPNVNVPYIAKVWITVFQPPAVPQGTVGAWIDPYTNMPGIPCERDANKNVDKPNPGIAAPGCRNQSYGQGISGGIYTYDTGQTNNCAFNGSINENTYTVQSTPVWFYDNGYVCHRLDAAGYPPVPVGTTNNDSYEKHILGIYWEQSGYPRSLEPTMVGAWAVSAAATPTNNPTCNTISSTRNPFCATLTIPMGTADVSAIVNGLAAGQRYRACVNMTNAYTRYCYVFPENQPTVTPTSFAGGNIPAPTTVQMLIYYTASPVNVYGYNVTTKSVVVDSTCPTSGNCSVNVPSPPQITNAIGYDVYARVLGVGTYYRQNTSGPVPIGTNFVFGTTANPFIQSGGYAMPVGNWGGNPGNITNVLAADNVAHTITIDTQQGLVANPSNTNGANIVVMRQFTGIAADAASTTNSIVCAACDFTPWDGYRGVPVYATVYCGVTPGDLGPFPNYALYSLAPNHGSTIAGINAMTHTITLSNNINCGPGVNFEIRQVDSPAGAKRIFVWSRSSYDVWKRFTNYIGADAVMWNAQDTQPAGTPITPPNVGASYNPGRRRESALAVISCQLALDLLNDLSVMGATTALSPSVTCQSPSTASGRLNALFSMIDTMTNSNQGRGASIGSFLDGLVLNAIINYWLDPVTGVQSSPSYLYWSKRLTDVLWNTYYNARGSFTPSYCQGIYPHEYTYDMESALLGICPQNGTNQWWPSGFGVGSPAIVADYWSIYGNIMPAFAFYYQYTGNAGIPNSNPPTTYGAAYQDMAAWGFVHMASMSSFVNPGAGLKTLGEMGIWQDQALQWMQGNGGSAPSTLTIITSSLPIATQGVAYNASVAATGGVPPYSWTSVGLPSGLMMSSGGAITGTPALAGINPVAVTVTDSASHTSSANLSLAVNAPAAPSPFPSYVTGIIP